MKDMSLVKPVLVQVALTFAVLILMAKVRYEAVQRKEVTQPDAGVRPVWTGRAGAVSNAYHNLLEQPVMFYAAVAFAMLTGAGDWEMLALAWTYVACRIVQAGVHVTYNETSHRLYAFFAGTMVLIAIWVNIALHVLLGW